MDRRNAIRGLATAGAGVLLSGSVLRAAAAPFLRTPRASTITLSITDPRFLALTAVSGSVELTNALVPGIQDVTPGGFPLTLIRIDEYSVVALGMECTHQQCLVGSFNGTRFVCPCHDSEFDIEGKRIAGPAQLPLPSFPAALDGTVLTVTGLPGETDWNLTSAEQIRAAGSVQLLSCVPHPFRERLHIRYELAGGEQAVAQLYDSRGRLLRTVTGRGGPGAHDMVISARGLPTGAYVLLLRAGRHTLTRRVLHIR